MVAPAASSANSAAIPQLQLYEYNQPANGQHPYMPVPLTALRQIHEIADVHTASASSPSKTCRRGGKKQSSSYGAAEHARKNKKARGENRELIQCLEDLVSCVGGEDGSTRQTADNMKRSGLLNDKRETIRRARITIDVLVEVLVQLHTTKSSTQSEAREALWRSLDRVKERIKANSKSDKAVVLPSGSLMADNTPSGEKPCGEQNKDGLCSPHGGNSIELRKEVRSCNYAKNIERMIVDRSG
jgi:hypothetical protein